MKPIWNALAFCLFVAAICPVIAAPDAAKLKVLLITGGHGFETNEFYQVFEKNPDIEFTHAEHSRKSATAFERADLTEFDVVVLYDMQQQATDEQKAAFMRLFDKGMGLVVLHHALCSYQHEWPEYERIIGGHYVEPDANKSGKVTAAGGYEHGVDVPVVVTAREHAITAGVNDFLIKDEIYWGFHVQPDVETLITTTQPKSGKPLGWCRKQGKSRVVYLQLGHDHTAWENPNYQKLLAQGIKWAAGK